MSLESKAPLKFFEHFFMSLEFSFIMYYAEANQERIVEAGGLTSLLMLLRSFDDETICRVAAGAIANLAMNGNFLFACQNFHP